MTLEEFQAWSEELSRRGTRALQAAVVVAVALHVDSWPLVIGLVLFSVVADWRARKREWRRIKW